MIGLDFQVHPSDYSEDCDEQKTPKELAIYHSLQKCEDVANKFSNSWIIGADTIVVLGYEILEKPSDHKEAKKMLRKLSGQTHEVITGYTIYNSSNDKYLSNSESTKVTFHELSDDIIEYYLNHYKYKDKAGAYAIQDFSALFVEKLNGCFYNVVGFPVAAFCHQLRNNLSSCL